MALQNLEPINDQLADIITEAPAMDLSATGAS